MAGKKKRVQEQGEVPMSSMIDVVFLLLIYFIVTQKDEVSEAHLAVNLPSPNQTQESKEEPKVPLDITVLRGKVQMRGATRSKERVREILESVAKSAPETTVMIKTSTKALNGELVEVLDLCKSVGLTQLNVATLDD